MATLDPVLISVLKGRLEEICDEMDATLFRTAFFADTSFGGSFVPRAILFSA